MVEENKFQNIVIVGLGYIGLPTAAMFANNNVNVLGVDNNLHVVETINKGNVHIVEPDLEDVVKEAVSNGALQATTTAAPADAFIIAVPTPFKGDHEPDLSYIKAACETIAPVLQKGNLVVLESTSPVGTTEKVAEWLYSLRSDLTFPQQNKEPDINVAYCPERVLPGQIMRELIANDRIIGGITKHCAKRSSELYKIFVNGDCITTNSRTAEMAKLTENSFRDVNIAFANELSIICDDLEINVHELVSLANRHPRVNILNPGCGVGGHCIAVDPWFIVHSAPETSKLVHTARLVNDYKPEWVVEKIKARVLDVASAKQCPITDVTVACLGLSYKPDIDDLRESPALKIASELSKQTFECVAVEPNISQLPPAYQHIELQLFEDAAGNADIVVHLVPHSAFSQLQNLLGEHQILLTL